MHRYFITLLFLLTLDLASKYLLFSSSFFDWPITSFFSLTLVKNTGAAFGLAQDSVMLLLLSNVLIALIVLLFFYQEKDRVHRFLWIVILAGGLGNMYDRLVLGYVRDFLHFHLGSYSYPVFNLADSYITVAVIIFFLRFYLQYKKSRS